MAWLVVIAIVVVAIWLLRRSGRPSKEAYVPPQVAVQARVEVATPKREVTLAVGNQLQPFSPIPLTIEGTSSAAVADLRRLLDDDQSNSRDRHEKILSWLLTTNARVREIDAFIAEWGPKFEARVRELCMTDPDWASAGELDRQDILEGASQRATASFEIRAAELDYAAIAQFPSMPATADDALLERYGFETLSFYFRHAGDLTRVHVSPSADWYRPRFEDLVTKGLAKRGVDVEPTAILQTMTLKDMEALVPDLPHKRFTRRAPAMEFLAGVSDLKERLGKGVSFRELFQIAPLPDEFSGLDLSALAQAWAFADEYAKLLERTFSTAAWAKRAIDGATRDEYAKGWRVDGTYSGEQACCPLCARQRGEIRGRGAPPRLPHHVGCTCSLSQIYE